MERNRYMLVTFSSMTVGTKFIFSMKDRVEFIKSGCYMYISRSKKGSSSTVVEGQQVFVQY